MTVTVLAAVAVASPGVSRVAAGNVECRPLGLLSTESQIVFQTGFETEDSGLNLDAFQVVAESVHSGKVAIAGQVDRPNTACFLRIPFHAKAACEYEIRFWIRSDQGSRCAVWARFDDETRQQVTTVDRIPRSWHEVNTVFVSRVDKSGSLEIVAPSSYGETPVGRAWIDDVTITERPRAQFHSPPTEDFPALTTDKAGQVWMAAVVRPIPEREIRVFRVEAAGRKLAATVRPEGMTGVGAPVLLPRKRGCLVVFAAEIDDRWRIGLTVVGAGSEDEPIRYLEAGGCANVEPSAAIRADGKVQLVWESNADGVRGVYTAVFDSQSDSESEVEPVRISSPERVSLNPAVVALDDGRLLAVWDSVRGDHADLFSAWCEGGKWQEEQRLTHDPCIERFATPATDGRNVWLAWQAQSYRDGHVTHLDMQQIVVAKLTEAGLEMPTDLFKRVSPPAHMLLRPRLAFDPEGRLWLTVRRSPYQKTPAGRAVGTHSGWESMLWCYGGQQWSDPMQICRTPGRWRP
ncbi:MAG TPA: hypothetical protein VE890_05235, partial [Thermoguttaceae bacterium]|nr:hypothetical protein [Thermoguttaceae bacterium]